MSYELKSARYLARDILSRVVQDGDTVIDATMGNGYDTAFLCEAVGASGKVFAFDIQQSAIHATESLLKKNGLSGRAVLILAGHQQMDEFVSEPVSAVVFNLGWLPGGNHLITTCWETTWEAVEKSLSLLIPGGMLVICAYPGHEEGNRERLELTAFLSSLSNRHFNVLHQHFLNAAPGAPECFVVQKLI